MITILAIIGGVCVAGIGLAFLVGIIAGAAEDIRARHADRIFLEAVRANRPTHCLPAVACDDPAVAAMLDACGVSRVLVTDLPSEQ